MSFSQCPAKKSASCKNSRKSRDHIHPPLKDPPKFLPVSSNLKGKVRVWGTPNHLKWDFGAKSGKKNDSLPKSIKIINFRDFCENWSKIGLTHQREAPKLALTQGIPMLSYSNFLAPKLISKVEQDEPFPRSHCGYNKIMALAQESGFSLEH